MKVINLIIISFSFFRGGAAIAASRFTNLIKKEKNITYETLSADDVNKIHLAKRLISHSLLFLQKDNIKCKRSINLFTLKKLTTYLNKYSNNRVFHFHWLNNDTLSIFDFHKIPKHSIITLHDEWIYCGIEHYHYFNDSINLFSLGYKKKFKPLDIGFYVWNVKMKQLQSRNDIIYTVPSSWMLERCKKSQLLRNKDVRILSNPIDTDIFQPSENTLNEDKKLSLGIPKDNFILMFGAVDGDKNPLKGSKSLIDALILLQDKLNKKLIEKITIVTFGGNFKAIGLKFKIINLGYISSQTALAQIYSLASIIVVPSLVEAFGQVAAEAQSCATPVIGYDNTGLIDIVKDQETGFLVKNNDAHALCNAIHNTITLSKDELYNIGMRAREHICNNFSNSKVRKEYINILNESALKKGLI